MKIIHTSDLHIDSPLTSRLSPDKVRERKRELIQNFYRLVSEADRLGASVIIIAGDLFDDIKVSPKALSSVLNVIERTGHIEFFYLTGNHEGDAIAKSGLELPKNLKLFKENWSYYTLGEVTFAGRTKCQKGMFEELRFPKRGKNICILHGELRERSEMPDTIGLLETGEKNIHYLALGHYHFYKEYSFEGGSAVYSGTPEGRGFDEVGERGFVLIDTDGEKITHSFVPFAKRRLHIVSFDISGITKLSEVIDRCRNMLSNIPYDDLVRLELTGKYSPGLWNDTEPLKRAFEDNFYYFEVKDSSKMDIRPEDYKNDKSLKGEFIRLVASEKTLNEEEIADIITCGISALAGEEIFED